MGKTARWTGVLLLALCFPGCMAVGFGVVETRRGDATNPSFGVAFDHQRTVDAAHRAEPLSAADLLERWGQPDEREEFPEGGEAWSYDGGLRWAGVLGMLVVVPVPLVVPVGREHVVFTVEEGRVVYARSAVTDFGFFCGVGWAPAIMHGGGWFAGCSGEIGEGFGNPFE